MRSCTSYCHQGRKPCPCPQACEVPEAGITRTALDAFVAGGMTEECAKLAVTLIAKKAIPSISISY